VADRPLRVAVDGRELTGSPTGVGRYLGALLERWGQGDRDAPRFQVIVPRATPAGADRFGPQVEWIVERAGRSGTAWEQTRLRQVVARLAPDVFFAPGYTAPLALPCPLVLAVHDVSFFAHPEWYRPREGFRRRLLTRASARQSRAIVTISEFSRREILRYLGVPAERVHLAYCGAPPIDADAAPSDREPLVLFVGSLFNRRHVPETIRGFARAVEVVPDARLVFVGDNRTAPRIEPEAMARTLGVGTQVEWRRYVSDAELDDLYRRARVFVFVSDYEGFALTPAEALARGVAPILADTEVAHEIYAGGARFVPPTPESIGRAMIELLSDADACRRVVDKGQDAISRFSWEECADKVAHLLAAVAAQ
jgi:glycosyltransferase involved in cell wall biosynthesis